MAASPILIYLLEFYKTATIMTLRELIKKDFDTDLEISGGFGNSIDNCISIHRTPMNDYVGIEYYILKCLGIGRRIEWKRIEQSLQFNNNKTIDKIKIETKQITETEIITQIENYYFDITECFENEAIENTFDENQTLDQIKQRIMEMINENDFNKKCIELLKSDNLFRDTDLTIEFLDIILADKSFPLYEKMMVNCKKPVMQVLRIISKEL